MLQQHVWDVSSAVPASVLHPPSHIIVTQVLERAWASGLQRIIITAGSLSEARKALQLAQRDGGPSPSVVFYTYEARIAHACTTCRQGCDFCLSGQWGLAHLPVRMMEG